MDPMMVKEQHHEPDFSGGQWVEINEYHSPHTQSPAHEFTAYGFVPNSHHGMPLDNQFSRPMPPMYSGSQHSQPVYAAQWPSMLTNPSTQAPPQAMPAPPPPPPPLAPLSTYIPAHPLPPLTTPTPPTTTGSTRRTLTDQDRRRMCQYHEDNPTVKQTEIGAMFGVERSTVSKVLRQKEKYLFPEDGSRSPIKRSKGKFPDIERALSNWARNHQRQGLPLSDSAIRDKARFFATTVGNGESHLKVNSNSWLEKFKQKNHLMGAKQRRASADANAHNHDSGLHADHGNQSGSQTPSGISPISPAGGPSPSPISPMQSRENLKTESPDSYIDFSNSYKHTHSQSATSLASCFTDTTAPSSFSGGPQSPNSPFYAGDQNGGYSSSQSRIAAASNSHRPRSQTFPMLGIEPGFGTPTGNGETLTPKQVQEMMDAPVLDTPIDDYPDRSLSISSDIQHLSSQPASSVHSPIGNNSPAIMAPPPIPISSINIGTLPSPISLPSQDEARKALELVMNFFQNQPNGVVDPQEYIIMGKLMEKLKVHGPIGELPGGMHSIVAGQQKEMSRKRSIHSL